MAVVTDLLIKPAHKQPMAAVDKMHVSEAGIKDNIACGPLRQVLMLEQRTLNEFHLQPGDLRENIIVRDFDLYGLSSGSVIKIGDALIGLTFLCEPCKIIADKVNLKDIRPQRGMLGRFLNDGIIAAGDTVTLTDQTIEPVPFETVDRIAWHLDKIDRTITAAELMWQVGLASSYCRALPAMIRKHAKIDGGKIVFGNM